MALWCARESSRNTETVLEQQANLTVSDMKVCRHHDICQMDQSLDGQKPQDIKGQLVGRGTWSHDSIKSKPGRTGPGQTDVN